MELTAVDLKIKAIKEKQKAQQKKDKDKLKALQKLKNEELKKSKNTVYFDTLNKIVGNDFEQFKTIIESNPDSTLEFFINGKSFKDYLQESN